MATFDPAQLNTLVTDLQTKEQALADASSANDQAQSAAQAAVATANTSQVAKDAAHDDLSASVDALVAYAQSLK